MIEDLQDQLILVTPELTEAHESLVSQYCNEGRKIDDASSSTARRKVLDAVIGSSRALEFLPSCGITPDSLTCHTTAGKIVTDLCYQEPLISLIQIYIRGLYLLHRWEKFYQELSMLFSELPRSNAVK